MRLATADQNQIKIEKYGATFFGRIVPQSEIKAIRERLKKPPIKEGDPLDVDEESFLFEMFDAAVTGWEGVTDFEGNEIPFSKGKVRELEDLNSGFANDILVDLHSQVQKTRKREGETKDAERKNS